MKSTEKKAKFVEMRANNLSYSKIAQELGISKSTCSNWEQELNAQITERKAERLTELYTLYGMEKESRIKRVGDALAKIDQAIEAKDLSELPGDALLKLKLKYEQELRTEYTEPTGSNLQGELSIAKVEEAITSLYRRQESGQVSPAQAKAELATLSEMLKAQRIKNAVFEYEL